MHCIRVPIGYEGEENQLLRTEVSENRILGDYLLWYHGLYILMSQLLSCLRVLPQQGSLPLSLPVPPPPPHHLFILLCKPIASGEVDGITIIYLAWAVPIMFSALRLRIWADYYFWLWREGEAERISQCWEQISISQLLGAVQLKGWSETLVIQRKSSFLVVCVRWRE